MNLRGYTLIEMIVVISVATMTLMVVTVAVIAFYRSNSVVFNQALAVESARSGLARASSDIRSAAYGDEGSYPVSAIATSSFTFFSDINGDGSSERVRYYLAGVNFVRGIIAATGSPASYPSSDESTTTLSGYVRNGSTPLFRFYTASSTEITVFSTTTAVAYVTLALMVDVDISREPAAYTLTTTAALRNAANF